MDDASPFADLKLLLMAADPLARAGLVAFLDDDPRVTVVERAAPEDISDQDLAGADVLLWDLGWDASELEAELPELLANFADAGLPVLLLAPEPETGLPLWRSGVNGVLLRRASARRLWAGLQAVAAGLRVADPELFAGGADTPFQESFPVALTEREREVLALLAEGLTNRAIGRRLGISEHTAKFHVQALLSKLGAASRTEAVVLAARRGLLSL